MRRLRCPGGGRKSGPAGAKEPLLTEGIDSGLLALVSFCLLTALSCILSALPCQAATITADQVEYLREDDTYKAAGNVRVEKDNVKVRADRITFRQSASEVEANGRVVYEDPDAVITADKALLNLDAKTGSITNAVILFRKDNFWITGDEIQKVGEGHYFARRAAFTTCDTEPLLSPAAFPLSVFDGSPGGAAGNPDWCFRADDVDMRIGKDLTARHATYRIKGLPVLYTPYVTAPLKSDRQTGFLTPGIGNSSTKGFEFAPAFFWVIDDHMDATFHLDYLSKRGAGVGAEYRHLTPEWLNTWYLTFIRDREFDQNFFSATGAARYAFGPARVFADVNYVNEVEYYKQYGYPALSKLKELPGLSGTSRFLQSSVEAAIPWTGSRAYLLGQYWVDLSDQRDQDVPQKLPELGYVLNPTRLGPLMFSFSSSLANFYREKGPRGARLDLNPAVSYSFGQAVRLSQSLSLLGTAYRLANEGDFDRSANRGTFEYTAQAQTRFTKNYGAFLHVVEPSLQYRYIPNTGALPLFDSRELVDNVSQVELSLYSALSSPSFALSGRLSQPYEFNAQEPFKELQPTRLELAFTGPVIFQFDMSYDIPHNQTEKVFSSLWLRIADAVTVFAAERYDRTNKINYYSAGLESPLTRKLSAGASLTYDATGPGLQFVTAKVAYAEQCWSVNALFTRKPGDTQQPSEFSFAIFIELKGLGKYGLKSSL